MSPDWLLIALIALGHAGLLVVVINVSHALGLDERVMDCIKLLLLAAILAIPLGVGIEVARGGWSTWSWATRGYAALCLAIATVGLPAATLLRAFRPKLGGVTERSSEIDLSESHEPGELIGEGKHAWLLRVRGNESFRLRRREWDVALPNLPEAWDGLSVVQLTDLHFAPCFRRRFFERVADEAASWEADLVLFTGDLVDHDEALDWIVPVLSRLRGRLGTFGILGNHDYVHHPERIGRLLEDAGFTNLEGRWVGLDIEGRTLALGGTSFPWGPLADVRDPTATAADFRLLLSHSPDHFYRAVAAGIELMLSGHNHGGQVRLPVIGPVFMPSVYSRRFDRGFFRSGRTLLHVSQGIAGKHPIRFGCVPEIGRFVLRSTAPRTRVASDSRMGLDRRAPRPSIP